MPKLARVKAATRDVVQRTNSDLMGVCTPINNVNQGVVPPHLDFSALAPTQSHPTPFPPLPRRVQADFSSSKNYGATYTLTVLGSKGRKVSKAEGTIIAASGTRQLFQQNNGSNERRFNSTSAQLGESLSSS